MSSLSLSSGGNQRETDRLRAQARAAKNAKPTKEGNAATLKKADSDADAMRRKQALADEKRAAAAAAEAAAKAGGKVVKVKLDL